MINKSYQKLYRAIIAEYEWRKHAVIKNHKHARP